MSQQPHLKISGQDISPHVLLPGDPGRVDLIGKHLDDFVILSSNREFRVGVGFYKGKKITICSTGIGCPSTAIAAEELINAGAQYLIRVGTCGGSWRADVPAGSIIIPTASIRDEGSSLEYIPQGFPAVANLEIINALVNSAREQKTQHFTGINRTHDSFYGTQAAITKWGSYLQDERFQNLDTPILSSEMESSILFVIASLRNAKAGAVFAVNANPESLQARILGKDQAVITESSEDLTQKTVEAMVIVALEALLRLN